MGLIDGQDRPWREHLAMAMDAAHQLEEAVQNEAALTECMPALVNAAYHLARAVDGLVAAEPQITRWQQTPEREAAGNLPPEAGTSHLWPPPAGVHDHPGATTFPPGGGG